MTTPPVVPPIRIAVIILNYRTPGLVLDCLETLLPEIDRARDRVFVVDNASGDGSAEKLRDAIDGRDDFDVDLLESPRNGGFAAGNNFGIESVSAEAYLLLNSDTLIRPGAIEIMWSTLDSDPQIGIVSPRLEWPDGTPQISCFRAHTCFSEMIRAASTSVITKLLSAWDVPVPVQPDRSDAAWTSFACVLIRREVFDRVGLLDESFFMYFEDADYCRRVGDAAYRIRNNPDAHVVHLRGGTSPVKSLTQERKRRPAYYYASRSQYFRNSSGSLGLVVANFMWSFGRSISWIRETFGSKAPHTVENEFWDVWSG